MLLFLRFKRNLIRRLFVYRSVFEKEPREFVDERIQKSRLVLKRIDGQFFDNVNYYKSLIDIPTRPEWDASMSKEELENNEKNLF